VGWSRQAFNYVISSLPFDGRGTHSITPAPHNFACSPAEALQVIVDLDLEDLITIEPPRGYGRD